MLSPVIHFALQVEAVFFFQELSFVLVKLLAWLSGETGELLCLLIYVCFFEISLDLLSLYPRMTLSYLLILAP